MKHALWAVNGLLGLGIVAFALTPLVFPTSVNRLSDIDPTAAPPSPPRKPGDQPNEQALITLRNPLRPGGEERTRRPDPTISLHGALPTRDGVEGVAFIRTAEDVSRVVPIGEEIQGWRLAELWKDRALFTDGNGRVMDLDLASNGDGRRRR
jgi:hypothetical protein